MEWLGLDTETVESAPTALERIDNIKGSDGFPLCMLGVGYRIANDLHNRSEIRMMQKGDYVHPRGSFSKQHVSPRK